MALRSFQQARVEPLETRTLLSATVNGTPTVVNINRESGYQGETTIAVNPTNPNQLFAASNDTTNPDPALAANPFDIMASLSSDGGQTWAARRIATGDDGLPQGRGDPTAKFDSYGNLFFSYIRQDTGEVEVILSTDGGQTFHPLGTLHGAGNDQPTVAVGPNSVWVTIQKDPLAGSNSKIAQAGAALFGAKVTGLGKVGQFNNIQAIAGPGANVGDVAVGPSGQVTVAYQYHTTTGPTITYTRTDPDGLGPKPLGPVNAQVSTYIGFPGPGIPPQPNRGIDAEVGLAYDLSSGPFAGRLYMVYNDAPDANLDNTNIYLRYSDDNGANWSTAQIVNDDNLLKDQFFPRLAVDPTTGTVAVTWYDARNSTDNTTVQVFAAVGTPTAAGVDFSPNFAVQPASFTGVNYGFGNEFGDYIGEAFYNGHLYSDWADSSNSTNDNPDGQGDTDIYAGVMTVTTTGTPASTFVGQFGNIGGKLTFSEADGTKVTITMQGGSGSAWLDGSLLQIRGGSTTANSTLKITARGGSGHATLGDSILTGSIGTLNAPDVTLTGLLSIAGTAKHVTLGDVTGGTLSATSTMGSVVLASLVNGKLLAGANPGTDAAFAGAGDTDDSFTRASIDTLRVKGAIQNSFVGAGVNPTDGVFGNGNDTIIDGAVSSIGHLFAGSADSTSRFEAGAFKVVRLPGPVDPATDSRFFVG